MPDLDIAALLGRFSAIVTGWGTTETGERANVLQRLLVPYVDRNICRNTLFQGIGDKQVNAN